MVIVELWRARGGLRKARSLGTRLGFCAREVFNSSFWGPGGKFPHNCLLLCTAIYN